MKSKPIPEGDAVAALCRKLGVSEVDTFDALAQHLAPDHAAFRETVRNTIVYALAPYRTGQVSITRVADGLQVRLLALAERWA